MHVDFLEAADGTPLTKRFALVNGKLEKDPYPHVKYVNSYREEIHSLAEFAAALKTHAAANRCLLKGELRVRLKNQSRAGQTDPDAPTRWLLLDLDFDSGWGSIDDFITELNPDWADVSYIFQHSASVGITSEPGLRGHLHILLEDEVSPALMKQWLMTRNLEVPGLLDRVELTASGLALRWPLDITTCQNDKLIYIAPPILEGLEDSLAGDRIRLVEKGRERAPVPRLTTPPASIETAAVTRINTLRATAGLRPRTAKLDVRGASPILLNPDSAAVTGTKTARGFTYINLNGGDSWGYYFPEKNPEIVRNFKGEPYFRLRDIDPDFYRQYMQRLEALRAKHREETLAGVEPYVFRDPQRDLYYNVLHDKNRDEIALLAPCQSKQRLADFMAQHLTPMPEVVEDWTVTFDPCTTEVIRPNERWINTFRPTDYVRHAAALDKVEEIPPVIDRVITHLTGDDPESKTQFLNWVAHVFKYRTRSETAWVLHGVQGTGKGLMVSRILRPLLGDEHVVEWTNQAFEDQFNAPLEKAIVLFLDEFHAAACRDAELVMSKLRNYISEKRIVIRGMRREAALCPNYMNVIVATNKIDPIHIGDDDRRWNVAPAQKRRLRITPQEVDAIADELPAFASYLWHYEIDANAVRHPMDNAAKKRLIAAAEVSTVTFFRNLTQGRLVWFLDYLETEMPLHDTIAYQQFEKVIQKWCKDALETRGRRVSHLARDDIRAAYAYIQGKTLTPAAFTRLCSIHDVEIGPRWIDGQNTRGTTVSWLPDIDRIQKTLDQLANRKPKLELVKK